MKRREALKSLTLSTGLVISQASIFGLIQSCSQPTPLGWVPMNFTEAEAATVQAVCNVIIPKGSDVGALDMNVPQMIDRFSSEVLTPEASSLYKKGLKVFNEVVDKKDGKGFSELNFETQNEVIKRFFTLKPERTAEILASIKLPEGDVSSQEFYLYSFLLQTRELCIHLFRTSAYVGEEVLSYDPIPGVYQGCIDVAEVGRPWSL
jgi:hypothetical protein